MKQPCVYIMASHQNGTLYTGVTSNLTRRVYEHREDLLAGFTSDYDCKMLVWYEPHERMDDAIAREKQIKAGSRKRKLALIEQLIPTGKTFTNLSRETAIYRHNRLFKKAASCVSWIASSLRSSQ